MKASWQAGRAFRESIGKWGRFGSIAEAMQIVGIKNGNCPLICLGMRSDGLRNTIHTMQVRLLFVERVV